MFNHLIRRYQRLFVLVLVSQQKKKWLRYKKSYDQFHQCLVGAFDEQELVGVVGFNFILSTVIIRHISVRENYQRRNIGRYLIQFLIQRFSPQRVDVETDEEALGFYQSLNFTCQTFQSQMASVILVLSIYQKSKSNLQFNNF
ncbi:GNAT family N-acetyltransferase [Candidatus Odyssella acanthamoebae]|uniref:GNAT family N-acetyltransferase n=1 Tax=Candidatus Odyssella acanthamoebae TaxID=91604 RepID=UPI00068D5927|nr:GNAT family N-acetyltransferase [Candidatus Paracaedibacter acanthamoebae]